MGVHELRWVSRRSTRFWRHRRVVWALVALLLGASLALTATPPPSVNYQGVLRDQNDAPLTGSFDMVLRFLDAESGGNEILVDRHTLATSNPVIVEDGLFHVPLGSGTISDGTGPGTYTSLETVFRDHASVWLEVTIEGETLSPRTRIRSSPYALNTAQLDGRPASSFLDTSATSQTKSGRLEVVSSGTSFLGAVIGTSQASGGAGLEGHGTYGARAYGSATGGEFTGQEYGVKAFGTNFAGAYIYGTSNSAYGVLARANSNAAGRFESLNLWGCTAEIAGGAAGVTSTCTNNGGRGVEAYGDVTGVGGWAYGGSGVGIRGTATGALGYGGTFSSPWVGVSASGKVAGRFTANSDPDSVGVSGSGTTGASFTATQDVGVRGTGPQSGAYFSTGPPWDSWAAIPMTYRGIETEGLTIGGEFGNRTTADYALVGYDGYKITGIGAMGFVQNHPDDASKVIVYTAPEGDEVAVYTRGSGRLVDGEARVKLGPTFARVTNPDIGLTATATPRGAPIPLAVDELSTGEMVVRGPENSDAEFDYMVWGLRIGFEEMSIVQPKERESKIPSLHQHEQRFEENPELRGYTALARFAGMEERVRGTSKVDLARAHRLRDAIGVFAPGGPPDEHRDGPKRDVPAPVEAELPLAPLAVATEEPSAALPPTALPGAPTRQPRHDHDRFDAVGAISAGDVVSLVSSSPGSVALSAGPDDALVIGCAQASEAEPPGRVAVATSRIALCRVDASFGAVAVGDRLIASPVPGTAMRAAVDADPAAALGRAIDPLDVGSQVVRVLLGSR